MKKETLYRQTQVARFYFVSCITGLYSFNFLLLDKISSCRRQVNFFPVINPENTSLLSRFLQREHDVWRLLGEENLVAHSLPCGKMLYAMAQNYFKIGQRPQVNCYMDLWNWKARYDSFRQFGQLLFTLFDPIKLLIFTVATQISAKAGKETT